jgi:4-hydroxymandelate oxidase
MTLDECIEVGDFEKIAKNAISTMAYGYFAAGATGECTVRNNSEAYQRIKLLPRMLVDVSRIDLSATVLGTQLKVPFMVAPTAYHRLAHPDGELATARAAKALGIGMVASSIASASLEDIASCGPEPRWFQLYVYKNRDLARHLVERAEAAGYTALALTVDVPQFGQRYADMRNHFTLPPGITMPNFAEVGFEKLDQIKGESGLAAYSAALFDASLTWKDIDWLRSLTKLPILLKGILRADDAQRAVEHGVDGIIVSNHGGRQLDTVPATIEVLPSIIEAVSGRIEVLVDGGIRHGTDVIKALALGAKAVLIGRPVIWGLAAHGQQGVEKVLSILRQETELAFKLAGCPNVASVDTSLLAPAKLGWA